MATKALIVGSKWVDALGEVWELRSLKAGVACLERKYTEPGTPGFCAPYEVVERSPIPEAWVAEQYKPYEAP